MLPTYDERGTIEEVVRGVMAAPGSIDVVVVDDLSSGKRGYVNAAATFIEDDVITNLPFDLTGAQRRGLKEIAERTHLPQPYLEQILLSVKGAGLVRSKRGVGDVGLDSLG